MALIAHRLERGPVSSTVSSFPEVFSMSNSRSESMEGGSELVVGRTLTSGECGNDR